MICSLKKSARSDKFFLNFDQRHPKNVFAEQAGLELSVGSWKK
jgi:hypothetical protein